MAYAHVAHNCRVGDRVILANSANSGRARRDRRLGDHRRRHPGAPVREDRRHAIIGGGSRVPMDVAPYVKAAGNPLRVFGLNRIGLERRGFTPEAIHDAGAALPDLLPLRPAQRRGDRAHPRASCRRVSGESRSSWSSSSAPTAASRDRGTSRVLENPACRVGGRCERTEARGGVTMSATAGRRHRLRPPRDLPRAALPGVATSPICAA